jgi:hypothetical protein
MRFEFKQKEEDIIAFNYFYFWSSPDRKWFRWLVRLAPVILFSFVSYSNQPDIAQWNIVNYLLPVWGLVFMFIAPRYIKKNLKRRLLKIVKSVKKADIIGDRTISIDDAKIEAKGENSNSTMEWSSVLKFVEIEHYFFMYFSSNSGLIFPKRIFQSDNEMEDLLNMVSRKIE